LLRESEDKERVLQQQRSQLEAALKELESFSYSVSHDLRAPLRAIDGFSRALEEDYTDVLDEGARDYLSRIRKGTQRMGRLIDDLLELSRVGRAELRPVALDLSTMAQDILDKLTSENSERRVKVEISPGLSAWGDAGLIQVALFNLLENAWKYTSKTAEAHIVVNQQDIDGQRVFEVRDNGAGFDMQYAGKLFGAFQRLHGAEFPGTGIGLATVQRIVHRHGGRVWAKAEVGQGASFFFTLAAGAYDTKQVNGK
ncbi:MAG TPA: ATP-binding protein, partial [Pseudomonadales bacterium]|nr:ATP-binding protein [Pseudomonadales bacterium]